MVDVAVTATVFCRKIPVDQNRVIFRLYVRVLTTAALPVDIGHILADTHDLTCFNWRVRPAGMFLVLFEVVLKHAQRFFEGVRANRVNARSYLSKLVKIKNQFITPLQNKGGRGAAPLYFVNIGDIPFYTSDYCLVLIA